MKLAPLLAASLVLGVGLAALAPAADALGFCTSVTNKLPGTDCQHLVCLYPSYHNGREYCHFSENDLPDCGPGCLYLP